MLASLLLLPLLLVGPPVVQGAWAFGHIVAMVIPDDVGFGVRVPVGQATMSRVCILFQDDSHRYFVLCISLFSICLFRCWSG
jgi:hypothetical protein